MITLLMATHNRGKLAEYQELLAGIPKLSLYSLIDIGITQEATESGLSFAENAILKALAYHRLSGMITLADDSGLEVDALGGRPGLFSSRYAGPGASDEARRKKLLQEMTGVPEKERTARFHCVAAMVISEEKVITREGICEGAILHDERGSNGFGYDPVFFVTGEGCSMAELSPERKNAISHRAIAFQQIRPILIDMVHSQT